MALKRIERATQIVGLATILVLCVLGVLSLASGDKPEAAALAPATLSGVPNVINYQGMLRQPDGTPINGTYSMTFRLYDEPTLGTLLHTETLTEVVVYDGLFTVLLGDADGNPIDAVAFQNRLYASVQVGNDAEMEPRQRIAPVPYAVQLTDGIYVGEEGNVGVGNTDPLTDTSLLVGPAIGGRHLTINDIPTARWGFATGSYDLSVQSDYGGSWAERVRFTESGDVHVGGRIVLSSWEDTAELTPGDGFWGDWWGWHECPIGSYVAAINVRIEWDQGGGDDTAMNGIRVRCRSLGQ
jgi:hypothetical protein